MVYLKIILSDLWVRILRNIGCPKKGVTNDAKLLPFTIYKNLLAIKGIFV